MSRGLGEHQRALLAALATHAEHGMTTRELAEATRRSLRQCRTAVASLEDRGLVIVTRDEWIGWTTGVGRHGWGGEPVGVPQHGSIIWLPERRAAWERAQAEAEVKRRRRSELAERRLIERRARQWGHMPPDYARRLAEIPEPSAEEQEPREVGEGYAAVRAAAQSRMA